MVLTIRKQVYLKKEHAVALKRQARARGTSEAALMREAIARQVTTPAQPQVNAWEKERAYIQALIAQGAVPGKRTWKREGLYKS